MPYEFTVDHEKRLIMRRTWGAFTEGELKAARAEYSALPDIGQYNELFDYLDVTRYDIPTRVIRSLGVTAAGQSPDFPGKKIALVAKRGVVWGMLRLYTSHEDGARAEIRLFEDNASAVAWLGQVTDQ